MSADADIRIGRLETEVAAIKADNNIFKTQIVSLQSQMKDAIERNSAALESVATRVQESLTFNKEVLTHQRDSLPVREVMKLFTFFSGLLLTVVGGIIGIKWVANSLLGIAG